MMQSSANPVEAPAPTPFEIDSLHILPLSMMPLMTPGLKRARLVKSSRVLTMVELFRDSSAGSGLIQLHELPDFIAGDLGDDFGRDMGTIEPLSQTPSFDVYSVRIALRGIGVDVDSTEYLSLSREKQAELSDRMRAFTMPLIQRIYGDDQMVGEVSDLRAMLRNPDKDEARRRLVQMAERLRVDLQDIPKFVEDYGDIFLSLAFFGQKLDGVVPTVNEFADWVEELRESWLVRHDRVRSKMLQVMVLDLFEVIGSISGRFNAFEQRTQDFWNDLSAAKFQAVRRLITDHHMTVGGVLCGLTLKMEAWKERFPTSGSGGPEQRLEFVSSEILPGLDRIRELERNAPRT